MFSRYKNGATNVTRTGLGKFVAAFAATNLGDVSPNIRGPFCRDTGLPCDTNHSTCNGRNEMCSSFGPGKVYSTRIRVTVRTRVRVKLQLRLRGSLRLRLE